MEHEYSTILLLLLSLILMVIGIYLTQRNIGRTEWPIAHTTISSQHLESESYSDGESYPVQYWQAYVYMQFYVSERPVLIKKPTGYLARTSASSCS